MKSSRLSPSRIARSVATVLVLSFIQTVGSPLVNVGAPAASASTLYGSRSNFLQWDTWRTAANHVPYWNESYSEITSNSSAIQFTQNVNSQAGFAWNTQTLSFSRDFTMSANYYFGQVDGADGIVFSMRALADWPYDGIAGSTTGGWGHWSGDEVKIFFDTYPNGTEIPEDHISIISTKSGIDKNYSGNGVKFKNGSGTTIDDVENNALYPITIKWSSSDRVLSVYSGLSANYLITSATIPTSDLAITEYNWGWLGFTGGANNYQYVSDVSYQAGPTVSTTATDTTVVDGTSVTLTASYASTESSPTTRWEYSTDGGTTWTSVGVSASTYTFNATRSMTQRKYRFYVESTVNSMTLSKSTNPITLTVNPPPLGYETDTALSLNGSTQYAEVSDTTGSLFDITGSITMEAWVYATSDCATDQAIIAKLNSYMMYCGGGGYLKYAFDSDGLSWGGSLSSVKLVKNEWHHIAFTKVSTSTDALIYVDGYLAATVPAYASTMSPNNDAFSIGRYNGGSYFQGQIDEVRIYNSQRTQTQIQADMKTYGPLSDSDLMVYYDFNEGSGTTLYNRKPTATSSTDLTVSGSPIWDSTKISQSSIYGPYSVQSFSRSYLTSTGGWKVPANASRINYLVVAGGGAGGGSVMESHYAGGGGGAGGLRTGTSSLTSGYLTPIVGQGQLSNGCVSTRGLNSSLNGAGITTVSATGGGSGSCNASTVDGSGGIAGNSGGSGGGGGSQTYVAAAGSGNLGAYTPVEGFAGGAAKADGGSSAYQSGGGGGGAAAVGVAGTANAAGNGGAGALSTILDGTNRYYAGGGAGGIRTGGPTGWPTKGTGGTGGGGAGSDTSATSGTANTGGGGGGCSYKICGSGGSGVIIIRWITALVPTYTKPTTAYLNAGMTETFTTNVSQDSATAILTRTFRWESTTPTANGAYTLIKQGTGAANATFSWIPTDTSTSGSGYLYRLTVTDSDTAGLFITDSSTAFAVINRALSVVGTSTITKRINLSKNETFTITLGTSTYRPTLSPVIPGITLDTSTAGLAIIKIADTVTVGTYYETLTVIDSVSASVVTPLIIKVAAPPSLLNSSEIITDNLVFNLDAGNSASLIADSGTVTTALAWNDLSGSKANAATGAGVNTGGLNGTTCTAPKYTSENGGALTFTTNSTNCYYASGFTGNNLINNYSIEAWFKTSATLPSGAGIVGQSVPNTSARSSIYIVNFSTSGLIVAFYDNVGGMERYANCPYVPTIGAWTHIAGTYDGTTMTTFINGASRCTATFSWTPNSSINTLGTIIGKGPAGGSDTAFPGSIATVRMYNKALTSAQILANYNATKNRFDNSNIAFLAPSKKYGATLLDSFTATSGLDTKTVTFSIGDKTGVDWETVTATNLINLTMQSNLPLGSSYDTMTVTDVLGQSTYLPITLKVTKADAITIRVETLTAVNYSTKQITTLPNVIVTGLVSTDSLTTSVLYRDPYLDSSLTCAQGGRCLVWDRGPGGGRIIYSTGDAQSVPGVSSAGTYFELAPMNWWGGSGEYQSSWASISDPTGVTNSQIGSGGANSKAIRDALGKAATAVNRVLDVTINGKSDWFLPTLAELRTAGYNTGLFGGNDFVSGNYWTSSESITAPSYGVTFNPSGNGAGVADMATRASGIASKDSVLYVRPMRTFAAARYETITAPTNAATYTLLPQIESISSEVTMNYQDVIYQNSSFTISQINQRSLNIFMYGGVVGSPYYIYLQGGNGTGAVTESLTGVSTLSGCAVNNHFLTATEQKQGFCEVRVVKAGDQNYYSETQTVQLYFMAYVNNQPTNQVGSGSTIGLNGKTSLTIDDSSTVRVPRISGFSKNGSTLTINGQGFGSSPVTVTFERYVDAAVAPTPTGGGTVITVTIPGSAISGPVLVITAGGRDSIDWLDLP